MKRIATSLNWLTVTLWVGALWAVGCIAAPALFSYLPDRALAGNLAGSLFAIVAWLGLGCGAWLLLNRLFAAGFSALKQALFWVVVLMLLLSVAGQFGVQPILASLKSQALPRQVMESVLRDRFATWHGVASVVYLAQSLLGVVLVLLQPRTFR